MFAVVGLPISLGATQITRAIPWAGIVLGVLMALVGLATVAGKHLSFSISHPFTAKREWCPRTMLLFGVGYGIASLGCTLPLFLALIGASLATRGPAAGLVVFGSYAFGMASVLMALAVGAALLRNGLARALKRLLPYMNRIAGALLLLVGAYLTYYWSKVQFAPVGTLSEDPVVSIVQRFTSTVQRLAASGSGRWLIVGAGAIVVAASAIGLWKWSGAAPSRMSRILRGPTPRTSAPSRRGRWCRGEDRDRRSREASRLSFAVDRFQGVRPPRPCAGAGRARRVSRW